MHHNKSVVRLHMAIWSCLIILFVLPNLMLMELSCNYMKMERERNDVLVHVHILEYK
ncbi:hypothetical protein NC651_021406 [Populus alba x Populus x berolinensis]|nr:hypothetical protein NC651_021406 [Populus alba x Populus x berolinensis]